MGHGQPYRGGWCGWIWGKSPLHMMPHVCGQSACTKQVPEEHQHTGQLPLLVCNREMKQKSINSPLLWSSYSQPSSSDEHHLVTLCHSCCWYYKVVMLESVSASGLCKGLMLWSASNLAFCRAHALLFFWYKFPLTHLCYRYRSLYIHSYMHTHFFKAHFLPRGKCDPIAVWVLSLTLKGIRTLKYI